MKNIDTSKMTFEELDYNHSFWNRRMIFMFIIWIGSLPLILLSKTIETVTVFFLISIIAGTLRLRADSMAKIFLSELLLRVLAQETGLDIEELRAGDIKILFKEEENSDE
jgi:hypothetical protein